MERKTSENVFWTDFFSWIIPAEIPDCGADSDIYIEYEPEEMPF